MAVEQGDDFAQCNLGICYENGTGVSKDIKEAIRLYQLSADQENSLAQAQLGRCYLHKDYKTGYCLLLMAAQQGGAQEQYNLGVILERGILVDKNDQEAERLYGLAAEQGHQQARTSLFRMREAREIIKASEIGTNHSNFSQ